MTIILKITRGLLLKSYIMIVYEIYKKLTTIK